MVSHQCNYLLDALYTMLWAWDRHAGFHNLDNQEQVIEANTHTIDGDESELGNL